ncbi:CDP-diacylglycerol--glycerol-3-phosphate 3-phosphatidyltransferase [Eubacterium brachy ATCC 33089]|nr:CDP-diacylglycerol--glycerol-3-phosphate 3-phosphatidyltransferase [Eubacterium brachy ATCC 33089]
MMLMITIFWEGRSKMNLPNKITIIRVIAVPFFVVLFNLNYAFPAAILFCIASATDALDGYIARKRGLVTNFGKIMDPLADKIIVIAAFILLVQSGKIPGWMIIVILAREFIVAGLRTVAAVDGIVIAAGIWGKLKTATQMLAIPFLIVDNWPFEMIGIPVDQILLWLCVALTVISGIEYIYKNRRIFLKGGI